MSGKPRRLLLHLETEEAATDVLYDARGGGGHKVYIAINIYINPDPSIEDQKLD